MKLFKIIIITFLLVVCFMTNQSLAKAVALQATVTNIKLLNVREKALSNAKIVTTVKNGAKVTVVAKLKSGWTEIMANQKKGYVITRFLKISTPNLSFDLTELNFIKQYATKGTVETAKSIKLGQSASEVQKKLGRPADIYSYKDDLHYYYNTNKIPLTIGIVDVGTQEDGDYAITKDSTIGYIISGFKNKSYTYAQIKKVLGPAKDYTFTSIDGTLEIFYQFGSYKLYFIQDVNQVKNAFNERLTDQVVFRSYAINNF